MLEAAGIGDSLTKRQASYWDEEKGKIGLNIWGHSFTATILPDMRASPHGAVIGFNVRAVLQGGTALSYNASTKEFALRTLRARDVDELTHLS